MEEETKPEQLLLDEKDVKLENDDLWGDIRDSNVKEELLDHDYFMWNSVKAEEVDNSINLKSEEPDDFGYPGMEPKPERFYEYPEHLKLKQLLDHDYCMRNPVKMEEIDESVDLLEPKLEEPDYKYPLSEFGSEALLEPNLDEPDDFEYSECPKLAPMKTEHSIVPFRKQNSHSKRKPSKRKCAICHKIVRPDHFICTESYNRQMILMLGLVISQKKSVEEAEQLVSGDRLFICITHLKESIDEIFKALNINSMDELNQCSNEEFQKLMDVNKIICPDISFPQFRRALIGFVVKFTESIQSPTTLEETDNFSNSLEPKLEEPNDFEYPEYPELESIKTENDIDPIRKKSAASIQKQYHRKCSVCREFVYLYEINWITSKDRKLILLLGSFLKGTKTIREAQSLISSHWMYTCTVHLKDAVSEIFNALKIKSLEEFHPYGNKNMQISIEKLLDILRMMCPGFSFPQFQIGLIATVRMVIRNESSSIKSSRQERWCLVCHQLENVEEFTDIVSKENKLILLVGLIVGRQKTMKEAIPLMSYPSLFCCESHLSEAGYEILEVLNFRRIDELHLCSKDKLAEVMNIVWKLCPECSAAQFKIHLTNFLGMVPSNW